MKVVVRICFLAVGGALLDRRSRSRRNLPNNFYVTEERHWCLVWLEVEKLLYKRLQFKDVFQHTLLFASLAVYPPHTQNENLKAKYII